MEQRRKQRQGNGSPASAPAPKRHHLIIRVLLVTSLTITMVGLGTVFGIPRSAPAFADTVVDGCTIVANPTPTTFTDCPGADFSSADLSGIDLSYANLSGATFATCIEQNPPPEITCTATNLESADLHDADVAHAAFDAKVLGNPTIYVFDTADLAGATLTGLDAVGADMEQVSLTGLDLSGSDFSQADLSLVNAGSDVGSDLTGANLTDTNFSGANLEWADLTDTDWTGADLATATLTDAVLSGADFSGADLLSVELSGTVLIPPNQTALVHSASGGVVTWSTPAALPGATPGPCVPASGSSFPIGSTPVTCAVVDAGGHQAHGTFTLEVEVRPAITITTTSLPPATVGAAYSAQLSATGGNPPYTWKLARGSAHPPRGLRLDKTGGISGTPTKKSTSTTFTVEVLDTKTTRSKGHPATQNTATATFTITVSP
jgi:uncharacterized protein YjbI with pentapeptide repeats